ncbi:MAG: 5'/3'-nucleotidase SurE [Alphaproteobacteria bacterium]|nr:5'/3'-nucleotidase SurE [Alphaproteobacteria bacterium]
MRILVSNDDGIHAPGLKVLENIAESISDEVWIIAPETEQSGASHSLTLTLPLRLRQVSERKFAVQGTPTDCVMMGIKHVMKDKLPDLVLSGVNRGANIADDVTYSGTIAAAMEGTVLGVPSIALSQAFGHSGSSQVKWSCAETHGAKLIRRLIAHGWPKDVLININFPDAFPKDVTEIVMTVQGKRDQATLHIDERVDARGNPYYWTAFKRILSNPPQGTDLKAIYDGKISVTPLHLNLTEMAVYEDLKRTLDLSMTEV